MFFQINVINYNGQAYIFCMGNRVQILSLKKNIITCRVKKRKFNFMTPLCAVAILFFVSFFSLNGVGLSQITNSMYYIYNPVNSLYSDNSNIVFASVSTVSKDSLNFVVPIIGAQSMVDELGTIEITVGNSILVKAVESGVVEEVGTSLDGIKYIKVLHSLNVVSLIENVDIIGVNKGDIVKKGQDLATAKVGSVVLLKLYDNNLQINNLEIKHSKIVWER